MSETKLRTRHPSTQILRSVIEDLSYMVYLRRLEPPMTVDQSLATTYYGDDGQVTASDLTRRKHAKTYEPLMRDVLRVLVDMGIVDPTAPACAGESVGLFG